VKCNNSLVVTITVTCYSRVPSSGGHLFTCGAIFWPPHHFPLHQLEVLSLIIHTLTLNIQVLPLPFGSTRSSTEDIAERGLWPFSQVPYRAPSVAVDCIALNYWGKHKRKMAIRGIN